MGKFRETSNFINWKAETCDILKCLLVYIGFNLKCLLVYIGFNLKCLLVYIF